MTLQAMAQKSANNTKVIENLDVPVASSNSQHTSYRTADPGEDEETISQPRPVPQESKTARIKSIEDEQISGRRLLKRAPGYKRHIAMEKASSRFSIWGREKNSTSSQKVAEEGELTSAKFVIIGIFNGWDRVPKERIVRIRRPPALFWSIWVHVVWMRGIHYLLSLKGVKEFRVYKVS